MPTSARPPQSGSPVPSPGHRSVKVVTPSPACLPGATTTRTSPPTSRSNSHIRSSIFLPSISASALSRPNRVLPPLANTYPNTLLHLFSVNSVFSVSSVLKVFGLSNGGIARILFLHEQLNTENQLLFFNRLTPRTPNPQCPQFLLQTLPVQTNRRRRPRNIPAVIRELLRQVRHLKFPLGLAKILFPESMIAC